jgi:hypothetical protein
MSDNPGMPEHDEPSAAELDRVRALLAGLGEEPAPPAVVARLERVLESQLPAPGAAPAKRRRPWVRRAILGALPVAAIVAGALVVSQSGEDSTSDGQRASGAPEVLSQAANEAAPLSATDEGAAASSAADSAAPAPTDMAPASIQAAPAGTAAAKASAPVATTPEEEQLHQAALDAYRETRRVLLDRRSP